VYQRTPYKAKRQTSFSKSLMPTKVGILFFKNSIGFFSYELWWVIGGYLLGIVGKNILKN
jgi:hypothetical protein